MLITKYDTDVLKDASKKRILDISECLAVIHGEIGDHDSEGRHACDEAMQAMRELLLMIKIMANTSEYD